jgi:hypothetical protein
MAESMGGVKTREANVMSGRIVLGVLFVAIWALASRASLAQQIGLGVPFGSSGHSFHEQLGTSWGVAGNGWFFSFGGAAPPPFGGFDHNGGARLGFSGPGGFFNLTASQGSTRSFGGQAGSITMQNGGGGAMFDQTISPFVTGVIPVLGDLPPAGPSTVLEERLQRLQAGEGRHSISPAETTSGASERAAGPSSAERGAPSVSEIKARQVANEADASAAATREIDVLLEKANSAIAAGKPGVAKIHLQMAARRSSGELRVEILRRIEQLSSPSK